MRSRLASGCRLLTQELDELRQIDRGEVELELAGLDLGDVEEVVEQAERIEPTLMDVLDIAPVACVADGTEPFLQHQLGEAEDRIERRADLVADLGEEIEPPRDHGGIARAIVVVPLSFGFGFRRLRRWRLDAGRIDQADQFKSVAERPHLEADLEPPSAPRQRLDRNDPLVAGIGRGPQQGGTPGHHRV